MSPSSPPPPNHSDVPIVDQSGPGEGAAIASDARSSQRPLEPYVATVQPVSAPTRTPWESSLLFNASSVDKTAAGYREAYPAQRHPLIIDLSHVSFLEHETLIHLGAVIAFRARDGKATFLRLPVDKPYSLRIFNFLRGWRFPQFIAEICGYPFEALLDETSRRAWLNDVDRPNPYIPVVPGPRGQKIAVLPGRYFWLTSIPDLRQAADSAEQVKKRFLDTHFRSVLDYHLHGQGRRVAHSVYEAVLNAGLHSHARMGYTSSQFRWADPTDTSSMGFFEVSIWDDGDPFSRTLEDTAKRLGYITTGGFFDQREHESSEPDDSLDFNREIFDVAVRPRMLDEDGPIRLDHREDPMKYVSDTALLTVAAFLTSVTAQPDRRSVLHNKRPEMLETFGGGPSTGGWGLTYVRNQVLDHFGGRIKYITGNYRLEMVAGPTPLTYRVAIEYLPRESWFAAGNHLILWIPLDKKEH